MQFFCAYHKLQHVLKNIRRKVYLCVDIFHIIWVHSYLQRCPFKLLFEKPNVYINLVRSNYFK